MSNSNLGNTRAAGEHFCTEFNWTNSIHGEVKCTVAELQKKFADSILHKGSLYKVSLGERNHHKGWRLST
jgi:hypothetical protein